MDLVVSFNKEREQIMPKWDVSYSDGAFRVRVYDGTSWNAISKVSSDAASGYVNKWALVQNAMDIDTAFGPKSNVCSGGDAGSPILHYDTIVIQVRNVMVKALQARENSAPKPGMR